MRSVVFASLILIVLGVGGVRFYLPKFVDARIRDQIGDATATFQKQQDQLAEIVKNN